MVHQDNAPIHVLIVDDDGSQRLLMRFLVQHSYPAAVITEARNGQDALASYEAQGADLIITDIQMPILDGLALTAVIRTHNSALPIIVVSGTLGGEALARRAGASGYRDKADVVRQFTQLLADSLAI